MASIGLLTFVLLLAWHIRANSIDDEERPTPPLMDPKHQPPAGEMLFRVADTNSRHIQPFVLECEAAGSKPMRYEWRKNGKNFTWAVYDDRMSQQPESGTLIVSEPRDEDTGSYQCFASNSYGTAVSNTVFVRKAALRDFDTDRVRTVYADVGETLQLSCNSPSGYPSPVLLWLFEDSNSHLKNLESPRRTVGPFGNLWFSSVSPEDDSGEGHYVCSATSRYLNEFKLGSRTRVVVRQSSLSGGQKRTPLEMQYVSPYSVVAQRGLPVRLWCIYGGTPSPEITWSKAGERNFLESGRARLLNHGKTLLIDPARLDDAGQYTCEASNGVGSQQTHTFALTVTAKPRFIKAPEIVHAAEGETAELECQADGEPAPEIKWILNGRPLDSYPPSERVERATNRLTIRSLERRDTANYGCNATNSVGYVYRDVYVSVSSVAPRIGRGPGASQAVLGQHVQLVCDVFGAPRPLVTWRRGGRGGYELTGGRYQVLESGHLLIENVAFTDAGDYTCRAKNKLNETSSSGSLVVKDRTRITHAPENYQVVAGEPATFRCSAAGDFTLPVTISWLAQGVPVDFQLEPRFIRTSDNSLTISKTTELDSKVYTCVAGTRLDRVTANATLIVEDRPNAPILTDLQCSDREAKVSWSAQGENRAPIVSYTIQYNTSFAPDTWVDTEPIDPHVSSYAVPLSPWANHTFRVIARNRVGPSAPSPHSQMCSTQQAVPSSNPHNVQARGTAPDNLFISWTVMPMIEHNAPDLRYRVEWRRDPPPPAPPGAWQSQTVSDNFLLVPDQPTYQRYRVRVRALNRLGESNVAAGEVVGWSGEDVPTAAPDALRFVGWQQEGGARLVWQRVDNTTVRGRLAGYRVQCWPTRRGRAALRDQVFGAEQSSGVVDILWPYTENQLHVLAFNGAYDGPPSAVISIFAKEGPPSSVDSLNAVPMGSSAFYLMWRPPAQPNGLLRGYRVQYQLVDGLRVGPLLERQPLVPNGTTRAKLAGLRPLSKYRIIVLAVNGAGTGAPYYIERSTNAVSARLPGRPSFVWHQPVPGSGTLHVTWLPDLAAAPGSHFFVQFRRIGEFSWMSTVGEYYEDTIVVTGLLLGQLYQVRVVSVDGQYYTHSLTQEVSIYEGEGGAAAATAVTRSVVAAGGWLVALLLALAVTLALFGGTCWMRRSRGARYDVLDRELLHGAAAVDADLAHHVHDGFQEYERPVDSKPFRGPIEIRDSDIDSAADDVEDGIGEDGSFIGQYMGRSGGHTHRPSHNSGDHKMGTVV